MRYKLLGILSLLSCALLLSGCAKQGDIYQNMSAQQIYERGKKAALRQDYSQAIKDFDALEAHHPYGKYTDLGQLAIIHAYAKNEDFGAAIATADRFIRMHPRHPQVDYAYYMKGLVNFYNNFSFIFRNLPLDRSMRTENYAEQSFDDFKVLIEKFPNSRYAYDARQRMILMREQLAYSEINIARYYIGQGADLAAANRAGYIVNQFPQTKAVPEALVIMRDSYAKLNMPEQSKEAANTLAKNFPNFKENVTERLFAKKKKYKLTSIPLFSFRADEPLNTN